MAVETPHFPAHFAFTADGVATVEQDSPEDVAACVFRTAVCPIGWREDTPEFGIRSPLFKTVPLELDALQELLEIRTEAERRSRAVTGVRCSRVSRVCHGSVHGLIVKKGPFLFVCSRVSRVKLVASA